MTTPTYEDKQDPKETLAFIRRTMESASTFSAVSGWGLVAVGTVGLVAAWLAAAGGATADLRVWIPAAGLSIAIAAAANTLKARKTNVPIWSGAFQKLVWVMTPALVAGALLTFSLAGREQSYLLPGTWLALYGAGVTAGGIFSVRAIRWMGVAFLALGAVALFRPDLGTLLLGCGFGGLHIVVGMDVVWRHGG
ncbi:MAG: hypothetical protein ACE5HT_01365 [Gemmatimonadales bacterium]